MRILIVSAHPDDEMLGMGGTIFKHLDREDELHWLIFTKPWEPKWSNEFIKKRIEDVYKVAELSNFSSLRWLEYRDNRMDEVYMDDYQREFIKVMEEIKPEVIYFPSPWDLNFEHVMVSRIVEFSTKPIYTKYVKKLISYEIPSATEWHWGYYGKFKPNMYVDITKYIDKKIEAIKLYTTEIKSFPHPRSSEYIRSLAQVRGAECGCYYAEGFHIFREVVE